MDNQKLFKLRITGLSDVAQLSKNWATHVVSILNTNWAKKIMGISLLGELLIPSPSPGLFLHRCYFDDVIPEDDFGLVLATLEDIQAILSFSEKLTAADNLLVHCSAGISRSTAVACGILCQHGLSPQEALETVCLIRKRAYPNAHIISLMDEALELRGLLKHTYTTFEFLR